MERDPLYPILTRQHLDAIDRRLKLVVATIKKCMEHHGRETVLVDSWG
jgi:hypothetical protein